MICLLEAELLGGDKIELLERAASANCTRTPAVAYAMAHTTLQQQVYNACHIAKHERHSKNECWEVYSVHIIVFNIYILQSRHTMHAILQNMSGIPRMPGSFTRCT